MTPDEILDELTLILGKAREAKNGTAVTHDGEQLFGFVLDHHDYMRMHCLLNLERVNYSMEAQEALHSRLAKNGSQAGNE